MKTTIFLLSMVLTGISTFANDLAYESKILEAITIIDTQFNKQAFTEAANIFERVSQVKPGEWLPIYYMAYCNVMIGLLSDQNKIKDQYFELALGQIKIAKEKTSENSEIYALESMIYQMLISVKPATRGKKYGYQSAMTYEKAIELDPENPRAYLMKAENLYYTPPMFGGSKELALENLMMAKKKFKDSNTESRILPHWGIYRTNELIQSYGTVKEQ